MKLILIIYILTSMLSCSKNRVMSNIYIAEAYIKQIEGGSISNNKENKNRVLSYLSKALKEDKTNITANFLLASFLFSHNKLKLSLYYFNMVVKYDPNNYRAYFFLGSIYYETEEYKKSIFYLKKGLEKNKDSYLFHSVIARLYATAKDYKYRNPKKALEHAKKAVSLLGNDNPFILDTLAEAYFVNKNYKKAVEIGEKLVEMEPNNKEFNKSLKRFKKALNKQ